MDVVELYVSPKKIPRPKLAGKHNSETSFQKISNTYPTIVLETFYYWMNLFHHII
jgi:hypothetical protein